jgi:hypothetical protein
VTFDDGGGGATYQLATNALDVDGTLTVESGTLDGNGLAITTVGTPDVIQTDGTLDLAGGTINMGDVQNDGTLRLRNDETLTSLNVTDIAADGLVVYYGSGTTPLQLGGNYYDLEFEGAAWTLSTQLTIARDLTVSGGSITMAAGLSTIDRDLSGAGALDGGSATVEIGRDFSVGSAAGDFTASTSTISFVDSAQASTVGAGYTFYNLHIGTAATPAPDKAVVFQAGALVTVQNEFQADGGGSGNWVMLLSSATTLVSDPPPLGQPGTPPTTGHPQPGDPPDPYDGTVQPEQWRIEVQGTASVDWAYVELSYANVPIFPDNTLSRPDVTDPDDPGWTYNWRVDLPVINNWIEDRDGNGKIDHIRVEVEAATPLNDDFSNVGVDVDGYTVLGYTTYDDWQDAAAQENDEFFSIVLEERASMDTDASPQWTIEFNTSLEARTGINEQVILNSPPATPADAAPPVLAYTLTRGDSYETFIRFSEPVTDTNGGTWADNFTYAGAATVDTFSTVTTSAGGLVEGIINFTPGTPVTADEILREQLLTVAGAAPAYSIDDLAGNAIEVNDHRISDIILGEHRAGIFEPVFARDETKTDPERGGRGIIRKFDGSEFLQPQDLTIQMSIRSDVTVPVSANEPEIYYATEVPERFRSNGLWLPMFDDTSKDESGPSNGDGCDPWDCDPTAFTGLVPFVTPSDYYDNRSAGDAINVVREYYIPRGSAQVQNRSQFGFLFKYPGTTGDLYAARLADFTSPWYRNVRPWTFELRQITAQRGNVTITNNVVNPNQGDRATLYYELDDAGLVRINVFNVAGDLIDILQSGRKAEGRHSTTWDGTNRQGEAVARGIYFIRVMADGIDEYRKVMVVK